MTQTPDIESSSLREIGDVNLNYLVLVQRLLREDFAVGLYRTGLSEETGRIVLQLSFQQTVTLASSTTLLCGLRLDDASMLAALTHSGLSDSLQQARMTMAMAKAPAIKLQAVAAHTGSI